MASHRRKRKDVTLEEWKEISKLLRETRNSLQSLHINKLQSILLSTRCRNVLKATNAIDQLRSDLENEMFRQGIKDMNIFYPGDSK